jgi:hypothetical protein
LPFHIVVRHRKAPQTSHAQWLDDHRPEWITTTVDIATRCMQMREEKRPVRVHREKWLDQPDAICCECEVADVRPVGEHIAHIQFTNWRVLEIAPLMRPARGASSYEVE